jgi:hypothetical protein
MTVSKLDNELVSLLKAQITMKDHPDSQGSLTIKVDPDWVNSKLMKVTLEELTETDISNPEIEFLKGTDRFYTEFLDYLKAAPFLQATYKDGEITARGSMVDLILLEAPLVALIKEHYYTTFCVQNNISEDDVFMEGTARLRSMGDVIRYIDGIKIILGGTRNRLSFDWQMYVTTIIAGEVGAASIVGATNGVVAFAAGFEPTALLTSDEWADAWDRKDYAPSVNVGDGWEAYRITDRNHDNIHAAKDVPLVVPVKAPFQISHLVEHMPTRQFIFELDERIAADFGVKAPEVLITRKLSKTS